MMHRQEPDPGNSGYWFRQVGHTPASLLLPQPRRNRVQNPSEWDLFAFIDFCDACRNPYLMRGAAVQVQLAEWQLLFDYCARPRNTTT